MKELSEVDAMQHFYDGWRTFDVLKLTLDPAQRDLLFEAVVQLLKAQQTFDILGINPGEFAKFVASLSVQES